MNCKYIVQIALFLMISGGMGTDMSFGQDAVLEKASPNDPILYSLYIRRGKDSFARYRYGEAKKYFKQAIKINPESIEAWSNYDLATAYAIVDHFKEQSNTASTDSHDGSNQSALKDVSSTKPNASLSQSQGCQ